MYCVATRAVLVERSRFGCSSRRPSTLLINKVRVSARKRGIARRHIMGKSRGHKPHAEGSSGASKSSSASTLVAAGAIGVLAPIAVALMMMREPPSPQPQPQPSTASIATATVAAIGVPL